EVAIVVSLLLGAHQPGLAVLRIPEQRRLDDLLARLDGADLARELVLQRRLGVLERVEVLDLGLRAELLLAARADRQVDVAAELALLHVAVGDAGVLEDGPWRGL